MVDIENLFMKFTSEKDCYFWLDSSRVEKKLSRFSFMGLCDTPNSHILTYYLNTHTVTKQTINHEEHIKLPSNINFFDFLDQQLKYNVSLSGERKLWIYHQRFYSI